MSDNEADRTADGTYELVLPETSGTFSPTDAEAAPPELPELPELPEAQTAALGITLAGTAAGIRTTADPLGGEEGESMIVTGLWGEIGRPGGGHRGHPLRYTSSCTPRAAPRRR
ncbi:hypothetical protein [Streptomyces johnsoniae]|uniref:Uncharacterized protein n=1 Tax=Streptomyces johnsoniae TaxID=3075532 RepID=A0ABU2SBK3_9ACTN|nr:hypothetical protein [Streptomyces sp. DSM 41886]MDT0445065.1 hypothetical protein [Streptomyces sp. DSM 41886]